jgi:hypothetical protein
MALPFRLRLSPVIASGIAIVLCKVTPEPCRSPVAARSAGEPRLAVRSVKSPKQLWTSRIACKINRLSEKHPFSVTQTLHFHPAIYLASAKKLINSIN